MLALFLQIFLVFGMPTLAVAGVIALEVHLAAVLRRRWDRAAMKRRYILHVLLCLRQLATQPPALQKASLVALYNQGVLNVHPEGFATYQGLLRWFYRQLDGKGRRVTLWRPESQKTSRIRLVQPQTA